MPRGVTIDTNLHIFQYKTLNIILYLNKNFLNLKWNNQTKSLWSKLQELMNSEMLLPQNTPHSTFLGFPDNKNFEIINHLDLIFKYYLFKVRDTREISLEVLKKNVIKIYNIEKQICFNDSKKETKFFKKIAYTRKPI